MRTYCPASRLRSLAFATLILGTCLSAAAGPEFRWRYYRPGNTGIQGDINESLWVSPNGDPYIGGYDPGFEEGGFAKFVQGQNVWENYSNVDYPEIGHPDEQGVVRFTDIVPDQTGRLWAGTWRGAVSFSLNTSRRKSFTRFHPGNSSLQDNRVTDIDVAPDGSVWFANGGMSKYVPGTRTWTRHALGSEFVAIQPKPGGGYLVWSATRMPTLAETYVYDSVSQQWTTLTPSGAPNEMVGLPGKDSVDDAGNLWALRSNAPGDFPSLHFRRPDGTWGTPSVPYDGVTFGIEAFKAYGNGRALMVDGSGRTWQFNGSAWVDFGVWRDGSYTSTVDIDLQGNVWVAGVGGAAKRNALTGAWQRYRITNTANYDTFNRDLAIDPATGTVFASANAGPGTGGLVRFDGKRWTGINQLTYGLGYDWPFPTDNCDAVAFRPSNNRWVTSPSWLHGIHEWTGIGFNEIPGLSGTKKLLEDSLGRVWALGEYYNLQFHNGTAWTPIDIVGWGDLLQRDTVRPGTIWASTGQDLIRTDGVYRFSRSIGDFPELEGEFMGMGAGPSGVWAGTGTINLANGGLVYIDHTTGAYKTWKIGVNWPFPGHYVRVLGVTPDGRVWMNYSSDYPSPNNGLCAFDGVNVIKFQAPFGGVAQWGGLPHASIADFEWRPISGGYEIWMSCLSRGIAVLTVKQNSG